MTVHINIWYIIVIVLLTIAALYWFVGNVACAEYCLLVILSSVAWTIKLIRTRQTASIHSDKHDMSVK